MNNLCNVKYLSKSDSNKVLCDFKMQNEVFVKEYRQLHSIVEYAHKFSFKSSKNSVLPVYQLSFIAFISY